MRNHRSRAQPMTWGPKQGEESVRVEARRAKRAADPAYKQCVCGEWVKAKADGQPWEHKQPGKTKSGNRAPCLRKLFQEN